MNWVPDRDDRDDGLHKHGHVTPPERNPVPEREEQREQQEKKDD
jgi:hypothetical protein